jgi:hypothetical protein
MAKKKKKKYGLTAEQLDKITVGKPKILTKGLTAAQARAAVEAVRQLNSRCVLLSDKYNQAAIQTGRDARLAFDEAEVASDRKTLESLFADDFNFVDPFGVVGTRKTTIDNILSGKVRKDTFETTAEALQVHGNTIVSTGLFKLKGSLRVRFTDSGVVRRRDISGDYHSTHTYVKRDGRLQLAASQLTLQPDPKPFTHGPDEENGVEPEE